MEVFRDDSPPWYPVNKRGQPRAAWPTLVAYMGSAAFKHPRGGAVLIKEHGVYSEPTPLERERAMGLQDDCTALPGASLLLRHQVLGRCIDLNAAVAVFDVAKAWSVFDKRGVVVDSNEQEADVMVATVSTSCYEVVMLSTVAEMEDTQDIWRDDNVLFYLRHDKWPEDIEPLEKSRAVKRLAYYVMSNDAVQRIMPDGSMREVPKPEVREGIMRAIHEESRHFGARRTYDLVALKYWWRGCLSDVRAVVRNCALCDRVRAEFEKPSPELHSLPVKGMMYRWGCDLAGPFEPTTDGMKWVMIMIEYFSKTVELAPLPSKAARHTAKRFASRVLGRYGAPAEVVTDNGGEWMGEFDQLLRSVMVDHRFTKPHHPQADGLTERAVQTVKRALKKALANPLSGSEWDDHLPFIQLAYNCSTQSSLGFSPYQILYAVEPTVPPSVKPKFEDELQLPFVGDVARIKDAVAQVVANRSFELKRHMPLAHDNLLIAQHRDQQRYRRLRDGTYVAEPFKFKPGEYVYLTRAKKHSLHIVARPAVLKVKAVTKLGVLTLVGSDGKEIKVHGSQCAPCHLTNIDPTIDKTLQGEDRDVLCEVCQEPDPDGFIFCDQCNTGWHIFCLTPPLLSIPAGSWFCPRCVSKGVTSAMVQVADLPDSWNLCTLKGVNSALQVLMPGPRVAHRLTRLSQLVTAGVVDPYALQVVKTEPAEVQVLLRHVRELAGYSLMDPFAGTGGIVTVLGEAGYSVVANDLNPAHGTELVQDALQPGFYKDKEIDIFVTSPYFAVLDLALPLMIKFAKVAVMVHVPGHYLYDPTEPRQRFFYSLIDRMAVILGLPKGPLGRRCAWLIVARSAEVLRELLLDKARLPLMFGMVFE